MPSAPTRAAPSTVVVSPTFPAFEGRHDAIPLLVEADQPAPGMDPGRAQPVEHRAMENALQLAAVNAELRHIVSGVGAAQFLPHRLAEAIAIEQLASADAGAVELRQQTELRQNADGVRQHVEADAEFAQLRGLLEYLGLDSGLVQREGGGKAADTAADDQDFLASALSIEPTPCRLLRRAARSQSPNREGPSIRSWSANGSSSVTGSRRSSPQLPQQAGAIEGTFSCGGIKKMYGANVAKLTEVRRCREVLNCKRSSCGVVALPADRVIVGNEQKEVGAKCRDRLRACV